jgi:hypothetical protein
MSSIRGGWNDNAIRIRSIVTVVGGARRTAIVVVDLVLWIDRDFSLYSYYTRLLRFGGKGYYLMT